MGLQEAVEQPRIHVESDDPMIDPRFGDDVLAELAKRGHRYSLPPKEFTLWPFSEPNGIIRDNSVWKSGINPQTKPTHAAGY
jgi:gamma-glutamyltranspeptidase